MCENIKMKHIVYKINVWIEKGRSKCFICSNGRERYPVREASRSWQNFERRGKGAEPIFYEQLGLPDNTKKNKTLK